METLAGKNQSNALAAALSNTDLLKKSYQEAMNSAGSAETEQEKYSQSIEYSVNRVKASVEELSNTLLSADAAKNAVDFVNTFVNGLNSIVEHLGTVKTLLLGAGIFKAFKGANTIRKNLDQLQTISCYGFRYFRMGLLWGRIYHNGDINNSIR